MGDRFASKLFKMYGQNTIKLNNNNLRPTMSIGKGQTQSVEGGGSGEGVGVKVCGVG